MQVAAARAAIEEAGAVDTSAMTGTSAAAAAAKQQELELRRELHAERLRVEGKLTEAVAAVAAEAAVDVAAEADVDVAAEVDVVEVSDP